MNLTSNLPTTDVHLSEYWKLKDEQTKRIEFRDQLIHVHLALVGAATGWGLTHSDPRVFLIVPWICVIMGWSYLVNDDHISALGTYIRLELRPRLKEAVGLTDRDLLGWEIAHRSDDRRLQRKVIQYLVDLLTFVFSGLIALAIFVCEYTPLTWTLWVLVGAEIVLMLAIAVLFLRYSDFGRDKEAEHTDAEHSGQERKVVVNK